MSTDRSELPRISIVTPTLNRAGFLRQAIESVLSQSYPHLEYIIIDGGSTDGSVQIIREYESRITYWCSEPDRGQADAIAKGFRRSTGQVLNWLNSDDRLEAGALHAVGEAFVRNPNAIVAGATIVSYDCKKPTQIVSAANLTFEDAIKTWRKKTVYYQPSVFFPRSAYIQSGGIDLEWDNAMDWDLLYRLLVICPVVYLQRPISRMYVHRGCKTVGQAWRVVVERRYSARKYWHQLEGGYSINYKLLQAVDLARCAAGRAREGNWYSAWRICREVAARRFWGKNEAASES